MGKNKGGNIPNKFYVELKNQVDKSIKDTKARREEMKRDIIAYSKPGWKEEELESYETRAYVNLLFSTIEGMAPLLTDNKPKLTMLGRFPFQARLAELHTKVLEFKWDELDMQDKKLTGVRDAMITGQGVFKVYFNADADNGIGDLAVEVIDPRTFVSCPGYEDNWDAPWCGDVAYRPITWIKDMFPEKEKDVETSERNSDDCLNYDEDDKSDVWVKVYSLWVRDLSTKTVGTGELDEEQKEIMEKVREYPYGRIVTFTDNMVILEDRPSPFLHGKPPYVVQYNYREYHSVWGMSENRMIDGLVKEFNHRIAQMVKQARRADFSTIAYDKTAISDSELVKRAVAQGNVAIPVKPKSGQSVRDVITRIDAEKITPSQLTLLSSFPKYIDGVTGFHDIAKGQAEKRERQTAQEISVMVESAYTRVRQKVRNSEFADKRIGALMISIIQQYYSEIRSFPMKNDKGINYYEISNGSDFVKNLYGNLTKEIENSGIDNQNLSDEDKQIYEDYNKIIEFIGDDESIYVDEIIQIDTNSSLPLDKQTMFNMILNLADRKIVDAIGVLDTIDFPGKETIKERLLKNQEEQKKMAMTQMNQGQGRQQPAQTPRPPGDVQDRIAGQLAGG